MRKSSLILVLLTLVVLAASAAGVSSAKHCTGTKASPASPDDPFGSCEDGGGFSTRGNVRCGRNHTAVAAGGMTFGKVYVDQSGKGAQVCNDGDVKNVPVVGTQRNIQGRVSVYRDPNNNLVIASDGDKNNADQPFNSGAAGWSRVDVRPSASACKVRLRRNPSSTSWWGRPGGGEPDPHDTSSCF